MSDEGQGRLTGSPHTIFEGVCAEIERTQKKVENRLFLRFFFVYLLQEGIRKSIIAVSDFSRIGIDRGMPENLQWEDGLSGKLWTDAEKIGIAFRCVCFKV